MPATLIRPPIFSRIPPPIPDTIKPVTKLPSRYWVLIIGSLALLALIALAASIDLLQLEPGVPLSIERLNPLSSMPTPTNNVADWILTAFRILMILFWVMLPFYIVYLIISKEARKRFLRDMAMMLPILLLLYFLTNSNMGQQAGQEMEGRFGFGEEETTGEVVEPPQLPEFQPPPAWVTTVTSITLALLITLIGVAVGYGVWRRAQDRERDRVPLKRIEQQAQDALAAIRAGGDLRETILRCYLDMLQTVEEYKNISRSRDVTPHEFENVLARRGLPREPIHQLTELFEQVRYGGFAPGRAEERAAVAALSAIVSACQRTRDR